MAEFYMPKHVLEAYISSIDVTNLVKFLKLHPDEDERIHVKLPPTLLSAFRLIRHKMWDKKLCSEIVLTNEGLGKKGDESVYRLDEGDYRIRKFIIAERIFNTHILYRGVYSIISDIELSSSMLDIPVEDVSSRMQDLYLAEIAKELRNCSFFTNIESIHFKTWCPVMVTGFASSLRLPLTTVYEYSFVHFVLTDDLAPELVRLKESYLEDLKVEYDEFKKKLLGAIDAFQSAKEMVLEGAYDLRSLLLKLMVVKGGSLALTPDVISVVRSYGYGVDEALRVLDSLVSEGRVLKKPDRWELCRWSPEQGMAGE